MNPAIPASLALGIYLLSGPGFAQGTRPATPAPAPVAPQASAARPADARVDPARTTATYDDWTLRCDRSTGTFVCEIVQSVTTGGPPVAAFAVGRSTRAEPLRLTLLTPHNISIEANPRLLAAEGDRDMPPLDLAWRRCLPAGCFADAALNDDALRRLRARTDPLRLTFTDGAGREVALPFSLRGLGPALNALIRDGNR